MVSQMETNPKSQIQSTNQIYLTNSFTPAMLATTQATVEFGEISKEEFCNAVSNAINAIGHESTVSLINTLCNTKLRLNRIAIKAKPGDQIYIFTVMVRLEEGKILSIQEIQQMYNEGKIKFVRARVFSNNVMEVIEQLAKCAGTCDERQYDYLANLAKSNLGD